MEEIVPISDLQSQAKRFVEAAGSGRQRIIITQRGRAAAVLIGYDEYRELTATATERDDEEALELLGKARAQAAGGERRELEEVLDRLTKRRNA